MSTRRLWLITLMAPWSWCAARAVAGEHGHFGGAGEAQGHGYQGGIISPGLLGAGVGYGAYLAPVFVVVPPPLMMMPPPLVFDRAELLAGPWPTGGIARPPQQTTTRAKRADPARTAHLLTLGDRLFRAGNTRKAEDRYEQARRSDPGQAAPHVRLAQLALVRGQYAEAAHQFREAQAVEPGWLITAPDVQPLFGEPAGFARHIAKLESHLQAQPNDRDAWLVLGAEWFLSGRTRKAADVFLRLTDRQPDAALAAFLDASIPREAGRDE